MLKVDAVFVCEACERRLLWRGARSRFGREILRVLPIPALLFALSLAVYPLPETPSPDVMRSAG